MSRTATLASLLATSTTITTGNDGSTTLQRSPSSSPSSPSLLQDTRRNDSDAADIANSHIEARLNAIDPDHVRRRPTTGGPTNHTSHTASSPSLPTTPKPTYNKYFDSAAAAAGPCGASNGDDLESPTTPFTAGQDPLLLRRAIKQSDELAILKKSGRKGRKLFAFYQQQNQLIEELLAPVQATTEDEAIAEEARLLKLKIAVWGSLAANVFLFGLQLAAAIISGSLALFATMADAFMDLSSSVVLVYTGYASTTTNETKYPTGKAKFETAGIIVFSSLMSTVSVQLIVESSRALASHDHEVDLNYLAIGCIGIAIGIKFILLLYCSALSSYPSAKILAQDHRNDLGVNTIGILTTVLGSQLAAWIDPAGAILIALIILRSWAVTAVEHIQLIVGTTASPAFLQRLTYLAMTHDPRVLQVDTCRAYNAGSNYWVEVDIVLPPEMPLCEAHDILKLVMLLSTGRSNDAHV
ncbi:hypothetical protein SeMB42_g05106 [Synchytrium endobioticum]|uniref:Uncharacterized protein n=1 Tax=Synchytrium endobioticum TaxID=286115 RepID=A0A507CTY5_9FUNG|nr:hypothetical protein SeMB42_g05106 [Synchytrium endobioticum]